MTLIHTRSVELPVNLDEGDQYDRPWLYAVEVGHWGLTDAQAKSLRGYLLRGGFFMCDDFHGTEEWDVFIRSMQRVFPGRPIVELDSKDPIFHTIYDLDDRFQVPGERYVRSGNTYEYDGYAPRWRGIYDDKGRPMVAICFDMDLGDSWEHADNPKYPETLGHGNPHRLQLRGVHDDALRGWKEVCKKAAGPATTSVVEETESIPAPKSTQDDLYRETAAAYGAALGRLARAYEADPDRRRDLLQEIHLALWRSFEGFDARCSLRTWVYGVAHNAATSHVIRERRASARTLVRLEELEAMPDTRESELAAERRHALERLTALIQRLKPLDRQVILSYLEGMDAASIGEITGISPGNVATKIHRIKNILVRRFRKGGRVLKIRIRALQWIREHLRLSPAIA